MTSQEKSRLDVFCIWCGKNDFKTPRFTELKKHLEEEHGVFQAK